MEVYTEMSLTKLSFETFEAFTAAMFQVEIWAVTPRSVGVGYQHFRGPYYLHLQGEVAGVGKKDIYIYRSGLAFKLVLCHVRSHRRSLNT
jgi:hypothetical protein